MTQGLVKKIEYPIPSIVAPLTFTEALVVIRAGGLFIFPTETFYGLGGDALCLEAAATLVLVKGRPVDKPVLLLLGELSQLELVAADSRSAIACVAHLAASFWPGPLTVCLPAAAGLPREIVSAAGLVAVRVSGHPLARRLCLASGTVLMASSANRSGQPPAVRPADLDPVLLVTTAGLLDGLPLPHGGLPSTIVVPDGEAVLRLLREGAVSRQALLDMGFKVLA
ncbi:L-threonylcarbamoyladenylate synthase [Desulfovibrionales bacterium]